MTTDLQSLFVEALFLLVDFVTFCSHHLFDVKLMALPKIINLWRNNLQGPKQ